MKLEPYYKILSNLRKKIIKTWNKESPEIKEIFNEDFKEVIEYYDLMLDKLKELINEILEYRGYETGIEEELEELPIEKE